ncbi:fibronectin type III domain-containing protein 7 [Gouania willdenowi]|uniref:Fibronectin type III domain-containing protein 7-like n=1 Tax=Gouania willdenowi TaxID=441366 RepID=A0A8C5HDV3_GOUWI|nr:fibronectin type III domain-containing protein 7-like [Gouania willdenowi]
MMRLCLILLSFTAVCVTAQNNDVEFSVFTVTSKTMTVQWSGRADAASYRVTATPTNSPGQPVFAQFSGSTMMGSVRSLSPNTLYTLQLEALDHALNVLSTAETQQTTAPDVPSIETAYSKTSDSITVEFTQVSGASSYILRAESTTGDFFTEISVSNSPGTVTQLQPYTDYQLSVMSVNSGGRSQPSYPTEARTIIMAPMMNTSSPTNTTIQVAWNPVDHAVFYTLCIIREGSSTRLKINTTNAQMTFDELEAGTTYCIKGTAWDPEGHTGDDLTVCQITRPQTPDVTLVRVTQGRSLSISVYWVPVQGATYYLASTSNGLNCSTDSNYCYIIPVECGQNHTVTLEAFNNAGPSSPSPPADYKTYPCPPDNIWLEEPTAGSCLVRWDPVDHVDYYITFIKNDDGSEETCNGTTTSCPFYCTCGYTYFTSVFPHNQAGSSLYSPIRNYTTIPCCPQNVTINLISTETLEVTWSPVKGAELYETNAVVQGEQRVVQCNDTAPVCALSDLQCNSAYSVKVIPCCEHRGCNHTCEPHLHQTAPCSPEILNMTQLSGSAYRVDYSAPNDHNTSYTVTATGRYDRHVCQSNGSSCDLTQLACGVTYEVTAVAIASVGWSLPAFTKVLETGPCCPASVNVTQVTQAMSNVTWQMAKGARSYVTALSSPRGSARCHTTDTHCVMGCITCGTNYSLSLEAFSSTGHMSQCSYHGFSSSPCCPTGIRFYPLVNSTLRVRWHSSGPRLHRHSVDLLGAGANYSCEAAVGATYCDVHHMACGDVYTVMVEPEGGHFCQPRTFSVPCPGSNAGFVFSRRRRSLNSKW